MKINDKYYFGYDDRKYVSIQPQEIWYIYTPVLQILKCTAKQQQSYIGALMYFHSLLDKIAKPH